MERKLRRIRQELPQGECIEILKRSKICVLRLLSDKYDPCIDPKEEIARLLKI